MVNGHALPAQKLAGPTGSVEDTLVRAAQAGDLRAYNALVLAHQDLLYNAALHITGSSQLAEVATQRAFEQAFPQISSFRGGSLRAWLMQLLVRHCRLLTRPANLPPPGGRSDPLIASLARLPLDLRLALVCVDLIDLSYRESAEILQIPERMIKLRLALARQALSQAL